MTAVTVDVTDDPRSAFDRAQHYLANLPVEHNLVLSLLHQRMAYPDPGRYWTVRQGREVVGFALQSPRTFSAIVTPMGRRAVEASAGAMAAEADTHLPGVIADAARPRCSRADGASWCLPGSRRGRASASQLANATSNAIYRRLGFEAVAEVLRYQFEPARCYAGD